MRVRQVPPQQFTPPGRYLNTRRCSPSSGLQLDRVVPPLGRRASAAASPNLVGAPTVMGTCKPVLKLIVATSSSSDGMDADTSGSVETL